MDKVYKQSYHLIATDGKKPDKDGNKIYRCYIYSNSYGSVLSHFIELFNEAKKDFPELTERDCTVCILDTLGEKGVTALNFMVKRKQKPRGYDKLSRLKELR